MVICNMKQSGFSAFIVVTYKVKVRMSGHVRSRNLDILIHGNVNACGVVVFIVFSGSNRECGYGTFSVVHNCMYIRREYRVSIVIDRNSRICPPEEGLRNIGVVKKLSLDLDISLVRIESECPHTLCTVHLVNLTNIYGSRAVLSFLIVIIHRTVSTWPVMLRPVEFDTAGDPWTG